MQKPLNLILALTSFLPTPLRSETRKPKEYKSQKGDRVEISPTCRSTRDGSCKSYESKIEFYSAEDQKLCTLDYSSEDSEHGFGVVKAGWTSDGNYFVFSLTSSGGHQAWHFPTLFYSVRDLEIHSLESYIEAGGISNGDSHLKSPNTVLVEVRESTRVKFRLDSLMNSNHKSKHPLSCTGGNVIQAEPYSSTK